MIPYTNIHTHRPPTLEPKECIGISSFRLGYDSVLPPAPFSAGIHPWDATEACHRLPEPAAATETMRSGGRRRNRTRPCFRPEERIMSDNSPDCPTAKRFGAPSSGHYPLCQNFRATDGTFGRILAARRHFPWLYRQSAADRKTFRRRILPLGRTDIAAVAQNGSIAPGSASPSSFHRNRRQRRPDRADVHCRRRPPQYTRT